MSENFDSQNQAIMARESQKHEDNKERAIKEERSLKKLLAAAMREDLTKQQIAKEALAAHRAGGTGEANRHRQLANAGHDGGGYNDDELVTGYEDRLWEREFED